jgi:hypothetical protein
MTKKMSLMSAFHLKAQDSSPHALLQHLLRKLLVPLMLSLIPVLYRQKYPRTFQHSILIPRVLQSARPQVWTTRVLNLLDVMGDMCHLLPKELRLSMGQQDFLEQEECLEEGVH